MAYIGGIMAKLLSRAFTIGSLKFAGLGGFIQVFSYFAGAVETIESTIKTYNPISAIATFIVWISFVMREHLRLVGEDEEAIRGIRDASNGSPPNP